MIEFVSNASSLTLAEQRRRDRINERMRALQELIPNSNKVELHHEQVH